MLFRSVDSLVIGNMRISQLIAGICVVVSVILLLVIGGRVRRMGSDYQLYCNTEACKQMMAELDAKREASGKKAAASVALDTERAGSANALRRLGGEYRETRAFTLPDGSERRLVVCKKISQTPTAYPRNGGKIAKKPL